MQKSFTQVARALFITLSLACSLLLQHALSKCSLALSTPATFTYICIFKYFILVATYTYICMHAITYVCTCVCLFIYKFSRHLRFRFTLRVLWNHWGAGGVECSLASANFPWVYWTYCRWLQPLLQSALASLLCAFDWRCDCAAAAAVVVVVAAWCERAALVDWVACAPYKCAPYAHHLPHRQRREMIWNLQLHILIN